ncbi:chloramphenicol-sensitive protein RarD [Pseudorhodobacter antarcticus]|jgi:chloramphenicol-sensitive protein RarD|uniref:Chloramphenicol-sensitive protein RarD n=1 Tax=Pseudorhodobacter antarcticus TaxID=1077947 RepID=A0A1H8DT49_9RHOB|nr:EamA family transporter RarD [Pseudorhodobacter antarcticus]SEN10355.1 chloramphenicol-sensitive protein RarD [Pseudorhodobacter antarcticus]
MREQGARVTEGQKGAAAMIGACVVWGLSPLYYKLLSHVPALEVLSHRTLWSVVFFTVLLAVQGRLSHLRPLVWGRAGLVTAFAALMMSLNWFFFIFSVQNGHTVEASLGFYIFPLVAVAVGVLAFGERLRRVQFFAIGLATVAVITLALGLGVTPWIAIVLAVTLAGYGAAKRFGTAGPVVSVAAEVVMVLPFGLMWLALTHAGHAPQSTGAFGHDTRTSVLLVLSGLMTATPLILFSYATQRVSMTTVGLIQYLNPTLQFFCAVLVFSEPFTFWHKIAFGLIWAALLVYSAEAAWRERSTRRAARMTMPVPPAAL